MHQVLTGMRQNWSLPSCTGSPSFTYHGKETELMSTISLCITFRCSTLMSRLRTRTKFSRWYRCCSSWYDRLASCKVKRRKMLIYLLNIPFINTNFPQKVQEGGNVSGHARGCFISNDKDVCTPGNAGSWFETAPRAGSLSIIRPEQ